MTSKDGMTIAAKCAPEKNLLSDVCQAGLEAVELFLSEKILTDVDGVIKACRAFPLRYALHAPNSGFGFEGLLALTQAVRPEVIVFHNIFWEDEWPVIAQRFDGTGVKLCLENTYSVHEPVKLMRRFSFGRCLDMEHLQMETCGFFEEAFISVMREASHIHLTGYSFGSDRWHTHIHHAPEHNRYVLDVLNRSGYRGLVVSEARQSLQTLKDFQALKAFDQEWRNS